MLILDHTYGVHSLADCKPNTKCYKPLRIYNKYSNEVLYVNCRKCPACLSARSSELTNRVTNECKQHMFNIFFTLTYDNEHVPRLVRKCPSVYCLNRDYGDYKVSQRYFFTTKTFAELGVKHLSNLDGDTFGVVCKRDVQLFLKRLRSAIHYEFKDKLNDYETKIRYFICSEYGSVYQRPHYHGIIFCDNRQLADSIPRLLRKVWSYCDPSRIDAQFVCGSAPQYVAKYLNGCSHLPEVLQSKSFRTFYICSKNPIIGNFENHVKEVQDILINGISQRMCSHGEKFTDIAYDVFPYSSFARYFPKCQGFSLSPHNYKLSLYEKYQNKRYLKLYDSQNHRYIESGLRGYAYLDSPDTFKYADYRFYKAIKRFTKSFYVPLRYSDGRIERYVSVSLSPNEVIKLVCKRYAEYDYLRLALQLRMEEILSQSQDAYTLLSFYPTLWRELPFTFSKDDFIKKSPFEFGNSYGFIFLTYFNITYEDLYLNNFLRDDFIKKMNNLSIDTGYRTDLIKNLLQSDRKKKFNELYNNFNI